MELNKEILVYSKCLSIINLKKAIENKPKILHIICHGGHNS